MENPFKAQTSVQKSHFLFLTGGQFYEKKIYFVAVGAGVEVSEQFSRLDPAQ